MGFRITALADTRITVEAPLHPNTNVHSTGFAGSLYALRADIVCLCSAADGEASGFIDALAAQGHARLVLEVIIGDGPAAVLHAVMHASRA